eukprot:jgi/Galph1/5015/GphlegSOOS_G3632.1
MKVVIVGNGSLGLWFSYQLYQLQSLCKVFILTRTEQAALSIQQQGVIVEDNACSCVSTSQDATLVRSTSNVKHFTCAATNSVRELQQLIKGDADCLLLCVKSYHLKDALTRAISVLSPKGLAVSLCNGLGNLEVVSSVVGSERAAAAVTYEAVQRVDITKICHWSAGRTILADVVSESPLLTHNLDTLYNILKKTSMHIEYLRPKEVRIEVWKKLAVNCVINPLASILRVKNGALASTIPHSLFEKLCLEIEMAAQMEGIELKPKQTVKEVLNTIQHSANNTCSMLKDIENRRPTEIDVLNGAVVRIAEKHSLSTPICETLFSLVKGIENTIDKD